MSVLNRIDKKYEYIVNVQGDEPYVNPDHIDLCVSVYMPIPEKYLLLKNDSSYLIGIASLVGLSESGGKITICGIEYSIKFRSGDYLKIDPIGHDFFSDGRALWMHMCEKRHSLTPKSLTDISPEISSGDSDTCDD